MAEERTCKNCIKQECCGHFERLETMIGKLPHLASKEQLAILYQNVGELCRLYQKKKP